MQVRTYDLRLWADPARVVVRPFHIAPEPRDANAPQMQRVKRIVDSVLALSRAQCTEELAIVDADFETRHWQTEVIYRDRFKHIASDLGLDP
ncbi:MAG: glycosidase, partial [Caulobacterales bacterium]